MIPKIDRLQNCVGYTISQDEEHLKFSVYFCLL